MDGILNRVSKLIPHACKVFAPQRFWHLYHQLDGLNPLGKRGRRCLASRYHFKKKTVNMVALDSNCKGAYPWANTNVAAIANVMKEPENFIFARLG